MMKKVLKKRRMVLFAIFLLMLGGMFSLVFSNGATSTVTTLAQSGDNVNLVYRVAPSSLGLGRLYSNNHNRSGQAAFGGVGVNTQVTHHAVTGHGIEVRQVRAFGGDGFVVSAIAIPGNIFSHWTYDSPNGEISLIPQIARRDLAVTQSRVMYAHFIVQPDNYTPYFVNGNSVVFSSPGWVNSGEVVHNVRFPILEFNIPVPAVGAGDWTAPGSSWRTPAGHINHGIYWHYGGGRYGSGRPLINRVNWTTWNNHGVTMTMRNTHPEFAFENVQTDIRGRGNSTWRNYTKLPFRLRFPNGEGRAMLDSPNAGRSWGLIANAVDESTVRNYSIMSLANMSNVERNPYGGMDFNSFARHVHVVINGEYQGLYTLMDNMDDDDGRVPVGGDYDENGLTRNVYLEFCRRAERRDYTPTFIEGIDYFRVGVESGSWANQWNSSRMAFEMREPEPEGDASYAPLVAATRNFVQAAHTAMLNRDWAAIQRYIDVRSFVDSYIFNEITMQSDLNWSSGHMHVRACDNGDNAHARRLFYGPLWDFDQALGRSERRPAEITRWASRPSNVFGRPNFGDGHQDGGHPWFNALMDVPEFVNMVRARFASFTGENGYVRQLTDRLELLNTHYYADFVVNRGRWPIGGNPGGRTAFHREQVDILRGFYMTRTDFIERYVSDETVTLNFYNGFLGWNNVFVHAYYRGHRLPWYNTMYNVGGGQQQPRVAFDLFDEVILDRAELQPTQGQQGWLHIEMPIRRILGRLLDDPIGTGTTSQRMLARARYGVVAEITGGIELRFTNVPSPESGSPHWFGASINAWWSLERDANGNHTDSYFAFRDGRICLRFPQNGANDGTTPQRRTVGFENRAAANAIIGQHGSTTRVWVYLLAGYFVDNAVISMHIWNNAQMTTVWNNRLVMSRVAGTNWVYVFLPVSPTTTFSMLVTRGPNNSVAWNQTADFNMNITGNNRFLVQTGSTGSSSLSVTNHRPAGF